MGTNLEEKYRNEKKRNWRENKIINAMHIQILGYGIKNHTHSVENFMLPGFLLIYCREGGSADLIHSKYGVTLKPGIFHLLKPFELYSVTLLQSEPLNNLYIYFDISPYSSRNLFLQHAFDPDNMLFQQHWFHEIGSGLNRLYQLEAEHHQGFDFLFQYVLRGIISFIICQQLRDTPRESSLDQHHTKLIEQVFDYVARHFDEPINISKIASAIGTSTSTLNRIFKDVLHASPLQSVTRFKIKESVMLMERGLLIKEVSKQLGYSSASHFCRVFKNVTGYNPTDYMKL